MEVYICSAEAISPQNTFDTNEFLTTIKSSDTNYFSCIEPDYKNYINPKVLRRMSKIVKMSLASSIIALNRADIKQPDAIIFGTGLGCVEDTIKFIDQIIENNEILLNPTAFIQSTHNTVAGQIALFIGCKNYNFTFTQQSVSFETALIDAFILLQENENSNILVGAVDEITEKSFALLQKAGCTKPTNNSSKMPNSRGYTPGEGSNCFVLSNKPSNKCMAKLLGVSVFNKISETDTLPSALETLLNKNNITPDEIDVLICGVNGDEKTDQNYLPIKNIFRNSRQIAYKLLVGEYDTASGFAFWLSTQIIYNQCIPDFFIPNILSESKISTILIHNYSFDHEHSFILMSKC